jgi:flagellar basal-body rod modification protein FlgD
MTVSASVNSILSTSASTPQTVTASIGSDGTSVDATTSQMTGGSSTTDSTAASSSASSSTDVSKNEFLQLLVTQLQNQDPTAPMDDSTFLSQLAQFQSLESSQNIQTDIEALDTDFKSTVAAQQVSAESMSNASSVALIGKQVSVKESSVAYDGATPIPMSISLGDNSGATVQILDGNKNVVKTLQTGTKDSNNASTVTWDGSTDQNTAAAAGTYTVNVVGSDTDSSLYAFTQNIVTGVSFTDSGVMLKIAGQDLPASDVTDVNQVDSAASSFGDVSASSAVALLGKTVRVQQQTVTYNQMPGENDEFNVNASPGNTVQVGITDASGNVIASFQETADSNGVATVDWNGQKTDGTYADAGTYNIVIDGQDTDPSLYAYAEGTVDGISNLGGMVQLNVGGQNVLLSNVIDIESPATASSSVSSS